MCANTPIGAFYTPNLSFLQFFVQIQNHNNIGDPETKEEKFKGNLVNKDAVVNFAEIVKKATCLMAMSQYNSNDSLTPDFTRASFEKKKVIWMNSSKFRLGHKVRTLLKTGTIRNKRQNLELIHDPLCFQNPLARSIYRENPLSVRFLRLNPSIRKPSHPAL